jgi:hypothetical protein
MLAGTDPTNNLMDPRGSLVFLAQTYIATILDLNYWVAM